MIERIVDSVSNCKRGGAAVALMSSLIVVAPLPASANGIIPAVASRSATVVDWLTPARSAKSETAMERQRILARALDRRHGRGSYICSASGFGRKSSCFSR